MKSTRNPVKERVRAVLVTADGHLLTIKRTRPGQASYWVLPGGGVEPEDASFEAALERELHEELSAKVDIHSLIHVMEREDERQRFYLARVHTWSFADRTGSEFADPTRGEYAPETVALTAKGVTGIDLKPDEFAAILTGRLRAGRDLFNLPDLREQLSGMIRDR